MIDTLPRVACAVASRRGSTHGENEDDFCALDQRNPEVTRLRRGLLFGVSDGVSAVAHGGWAARTTCERLQGFFSSSVPPSLDGLMQILNEIDWELRGQGQAACTLALLWLAEGQARLVMVGDSSVYRIRHGRIAPMGDGSPGGGGLKVYMGVGRTLNEVAQVLHEPLLPGDLFLLATDGLARLLPEEDLAAAWWRAGGDPQACADSLTAKVEALKGRDDATVMVVDVLAVETAGE